MSVPPHQRQVSLRGASAREITRDALLEKVSHQRELRSYLRRAAAAALFIQRVWRRYSELKKVSVQLREEWEELIDRHKSSMTAKWISDRVLRPFLFFITPRPWFYQKDDLQMVNSASCCFTILLSSINSSDPEKNFCLLSVGAQEERSTWQYQAKKLITLCFAILAECNFSKLGGATEKTVQLTALTMRLSISLTDSKTWKALISENLREADVPVRKLIAFLASERSSTYSCIRRYMTNLNTNKQTEKPIAPTDDRLLITASAVTLALRPFNLKDIEGDGYDMRRAYVEYVVYILTIPYLFRCLPSLLLPAVCHPSVLQPCLSILRTSEAEIFEEISRLQSSEKEALFAHKIPYPAWLLANIINLPTDSGHMTADFDCQLYIQAVNCTSSNLLKHLETNKESVDEIINDVKLSYVDLLKPVHQQWHLTKLLSLSKGGNSLIDVIQFYYYMLQFFCVLNPVIGSMSILNVLSFNPEFVVKLWISLECSIFGANGQSTGGIKNCSRGVTSQTRQNKGFKDTKWSNMLQKIKGKSFETDETNLTSCSPVADVASSQDEFEMWDVEAVKKEISKELLCSLHLFCAVYGHLLLVLDDIEFYEKQVPFTLDQQRKIASTLNTFVYNSFAQTGSQANKLLTNVTTRCLHLLYERDCRHRFCPDSLWLAPGRNDRIPIAAAARLHEAASMQGADSSCASSVLTTVPHVFPFEERVQIFREFVKLDKATRRISEPGQIEIVVRRDQIVEDGYRQLSHLGSRLKSSLHVSFVSECGLPEAGLDYGGLSKEFLTDVLKAAFNPEFGLFTQTSTSDSNLIPCMSARILPNGMEMLEFLGQIVGKAMYEGILLDYSFSLVFVQKLLGRYSFLDELSTLDSELYRNLMHLKHFDGDASELCLDFTITEELCGKMIVHELRPGGTNVPVTSENKLQYVHDMADFKLNRQILPFSNAFYRGLSDLISPSWLSLFNANEFNQLLSGGKQDFDVDDLRTNTKYTGGYSDSSRAVKLFWEVIRGFNPKERCLLLKFVTSCSRAPLLGFKYLQPSFTIHKVACDVPLWATIGGQDVDRLPSASTCYNTLKLPTYKRASTLRSKLLYAISSNTGFELS
ncbi:hypothetical protein LUZ63_015915 [Rhynchospora breviuscula]|uniref:HECT-type E3 ubiquitin transferase n=1 Tax=Rhynchospora breviuscula TaxID=2022672 RepID=A0A9Q0CDK0_9POAL|nr:hypothetical protein LUZ63_015915 [Rhynchospora breviuscula]